MSWQPTASISDLKARAQFLDKIRAFFKALHYLEVETPYLAHFGVSDVYLKNIEAHFRGKSYFLQTSPEYHMKRLLAAASGPIFQIARVFRDDEFGRWHNPEFSLLEWYQLDVDHWYLIHQMQDLFQYLFACPDFKCMSYQAAFEEFCEINPLETSVERLKAVCKAHHLDGVLNTDDECDDYLNLLMAMVVEPKLAHIPSPVVIYDFPASQASLAKIEHGVAHRFEVYWQGVELANGFHELTDSRLQETRFLQDLEKRARLGLTIPEMDNLFLDALKSGLPECSGVALGLDRLLALALNQPSIAKVMSFSFPTL